VPFPTMAEATGKFPTANAAFQLSNHFT